MLQTSAWRRRFLFVDANPVIVFLVLSDVIIIGAQEMMGPVFAIFVIQQIQGGNAAVVGVAAGVYAVVKSLAQVPLAFLVDKISGERDDYWAVVLGSLLMAMLPLTYLVIDRPSQLYLIQGLLGLGAALAYPPYMAIFTRHIDRKQEGKEWGIRFTLVDLAAAAAAAIGGFIAFTLGFHTLIVIYVVIGLLGVTALFPIRRHLRQK